MTAQALFHRYFPGIYLALAALLGITAGWVAVVFMDLWLAPPVTTTDMRPESRVTVAQQRPLSDYEVILSRNIFDSSGPLIVALEDTPTTAAEPAQVRDEAPPQRATRTSLTLIGTVVAGEQSIALIQEGRIAELYRLDEEVPGGGVIEEIDRNLVVLRHPDGSRENLMLPVEGAPAAPATRRTAAAAAAVPEDSVAARYNIQQIGDNKWQIPRQAAEDARGNLNELLRQARMEPRIVGGATEGFIVRMIRPNSFLDMLGIRRGDILMEINNIQLNSPERALQIFQQLREARSIAVSLVRDGEPVTFEYEIN
ncbi:type II secretion system protein C (GspC) [Geoalkalibacter ferrihydriticus]|uniref:Type II secretion system protein GspC N-terminal domain-containing protein n=2 Tax=Geoalkalibacter ferrihydriticus TaxID=392333 RepID=A0A0C2EB68_9BACT|nr:type II secretion system protein GspC [Geoalkalibacter ferrihydriticus]KIH75838.1 hypothetical protein GFER_14745 [Geoalkalibacter ferrihydriticus DSM 17813]SDM67529.1 type II secretion system protein C (GspC) [Geoalkalibacter ferrihydriticus]